MTNEPKESPPESEPTNSGAGDAVPFLVSVLSMIAVLVTVELFYRDSAVAQRLRKANYVTAKRADYETLGGDVVWTGDSRMYHGLNPQVMQESLQVATGSTYTAFDFGLPSGTTAMFVATAHEAAIHKPPPRVFILGVTPALFSCCDGIDRVQSGVRWSAVPLFARASWYTNVEDAGASVFYGASHLMGTRAELSAAVHDLAMPAPLSFQSRGYVSMGGRVPAGVQEQRAKGRAAAYAELMDKSKGIELRPTAGRYLGAAIADLKRHGVKVVVMGTPQARQLDWYHDEKHTYFEYIEEVKRITAAYGVPFVDMNHPPGIESGDFTDGDHLSEPGTTLFTKYVATEVVAPLLK